MLYLYKSWGGGKLKCWGGVCAASLTVPWQGMDLYLAVLREEQWKTILRERELCHSLFQPNPGKKMVSYPSHPIDCSCNVFSLHLCDHHTYWRGWVHRSVWAVAVSHEADRRQCCQQPSMFLFPGCSFPILDAQTLPVAPCFAVSVVCIALRFRCGTVVLSHTLN